MPFELWDTQSMSYGRTICVQTATKRIWWHNGNGNNIYEYDVANKSLTVIGDAADFATGDHKSEFALGALNNKLYVVHTLDYQVSGNQEVRVYEYSGTPGTWTQRSLESFNDGNTNSVFVAMLSMGDDMSYIAIPDGATSGAANLGRYSTNGTTWSQNTVGNLKAVFSSMWPIFSGHSVRKLPYLGSTLSTPYAATAYEYQGAGVWTARGSYMKDYVSWPTWDTYWALISGNYDYTPAILSTAFANSSPTYVYPCKTVNNNGVDVGIYLNASQLELYTFNNGSGTWTYKEDLPGSFSLSTSPGVFFFTFNDAEQVIMVPTGASSYNILRQPGFDYQSGATLVGEIVGGDDASLTWS